MPDLVTVINPRTGKPVTMLRSLAELPGLWLDMSHVTREDALALTAHLLGENPACAADNQNDTTHQRTGAA